MEDSEHHDEHKHVHMKRLSQFVLDVNFLSHMHKVAPLQSASKREQLIKEVKSDMSVPVHSAHPNTNFYSNVRSLYTSLIHDYHTHPLENKKLLYSAVMLMEWLFAAKSHNMTPTSKGSNPTGNSLTAAITSTLTSAIGHSSHVQHRANIKPEEALQLATLHFTIWSADYVYTNVYHLERAYTWFQHFFTQKPTHDVLEDLLTYFFVLQHKGDHESAFSLISNILNVYDNSHPLYVNLQFYAGCAAKGCGMLEKANVYFFDSSQLGPVKHFTRLEMMTLISRTIEEHNASNGNYDNQEGGNELTNDDNEAYQMVHTHLLQEHLIDLDYDDWLSSMHTWLALGDKCSFHNMHSLVADFVALAITKDANAFSNSKVWLKFAKACRRCGRHSDALLAIQQALTRDPHNTQLQRIHKVWKVSLKEYLDSYIDPMIRNDDIQALLQNIHLPETEAHKSIRKLQAVFRGMFMRFVWDRGVGRTWAGVYTEDHHDDAPSSPVRAPSPLMTTTLPHTPSQAYRRGKELVCKGGIHIHGVYLLAYVRSDKMGTIYNVHMHDVAYGHAYVLSLHTPFAPCMKSGGVYVCSLSMHLHTHTHSPSPVPLQSSEDLYPPDSVCVLVLRFTDVQTQQWWERRVGWFVRLPTKNQVAVAQDPSHTHGAPRRLRFSEVAVMGTKIDIAAETNPDAHDGTHTASTSPLTLAEGDGEGGGEGSRVHYTLHSDVTKTQVLTNTHSVVVAKFGLAYTHRLQSRAASPALPASPSSPPHAVSPSAKPIYYLVRISNEKDVTQITLTQAHTPYLVVLLCVREYIDRYTLYEQKLRKLLDGMYAHAVLGRLLQPPSRKHKHKDLPTTDTIHTPSYTYIYQRLPSHSGVSLIVANNHGGGVVGSGAEVEMGEGVERGEQQGDEEGVGVGADGESVGSISIAEDDLGDMGEEAEDAHTVSSLSSAHTFNSIRTADTAALQEDAAMSEKDRQAAQALAEEQMQLQKALDELALYVYNELLNEGVQEHIQHLVPATLEAYKQKHDKVVDKVLDGVMDMYGYYIFNWVCAEYIATRRSVYGSLYTGIHNATKTICMRPEKQEADESTVRAPSPTPIAPPVPSPESLWEVIHTPPPSVSKRVYKIPVEVEEHEENVSSAPYQFTSLPSKLKSSQYAHIHTPTPGQNTPLVGLLRRRVRKQPKAHSVASALPDLMMGDGDASVHSGMTSSYASVQSDAQSYLSLAFNTAEDLKAYLAHTSNSNDMFSLDSAGSAQQSFQQSLSHSTQSLQSKYNTLQQDLHTLPRLHKRQRKPKKILFSSSFNPLQDKDDESSVGRSLSSTSYSMGRFSIERSIQSGELLLGTNKPAPANPQPSQLPGTLHKSREMLSKYGDQEDGLLIQSVKNVQRLGYVPTISTGNTRRPVRRPWAYAAYWQRLLQDFLANHAVNNVSHMQANPPQSPSQLPTSSSSAATSRPPFYYLRKQLTTLNKALATTRPLLPSATPHPNPSQRGQLSVEEMVCGLAECKGSVGEVVSRLHHPTMGFLSEIQLACGSLNVKSLLCSFPGGGELVGELKALLQGEGAGTPAAFDADATDLFSPENTGDNMFTATSGSDQVNQPTNTRTTANDDEELSNITPVTLPQQHRSDASTSSNNSNMPTLIKPHLIKKLSRPPTLPSLRDEQPSASHLLYPHLHLQTQSPLVLHRASSVKLFSTQYNVSSPNMRAQQQGSLPSLQIDEVEREAEGRETEVTELFGPPPTNPTPHPLPSPSATPKPIKMPPSKMVSFSISPPSPTHSVGSRSKSGLLGSGGSGMGLALSTGSGDSEDSSLSHSISLSPRIRPQPTPSPHHVMDKSVSFRVHSQLVETLFTESLNDEAPIIVMSRKDALKAQQEENLLKSNKVYIKEKIKRRM